MRTNKCRICKKRILYLAPTVKIDGGAVVHARCAPKPEKAPPKRHPYAE